MSGDAYEISPRSGRLRKRIRLKKKRPKKSFKTKLLAFIKHPLFILSIVAAICFIFYLSLKEPAKNDSRKQPTKKGEGLNNKIKDGDLLDDNKK